VVDREAGAEEEDGRSWLGDREDEVDQVGEEDRQQIEKHTVEGPATYHWPGQGSRS
jgi:hypothetical protein